MMICGGGSTTIFFVCWGLFILWYVFGIIKLVNLPCQVNPHVITLRLLEKVAVSWCLVALLFHAAPSCENFPCVQQYLLENYGNGLWGCPCLGSVSACRVQVLWLLVFTTLTIWFLCIQIISCCICCIMVSIWGRILNTFVATLDTGVGWMVGTMVGPGFGVGVYSGSWDGQWNGSPDMCVAMSLTRFAWWHPEASIVSLLAVGCEKWVLKLIQFCCIGFIRLQVLIASCNFLVLLIIV